mgnify:CR=1 FL=1|jgi:ribonuclease HI
MQQQDISYKIFGREIKIELPEFREIKNKKNPYILGEVEKEGKRYTIYQGKNGISIVPFSPEVYLDLILNLKTKENDEGIFVDGNQEGFCILDTQGGKIKKILLCENKSTSNKNEFLAILYAYRIFKEEIKKGKNIFSDSKFAIDKIKKLYSIEAKKVKAHSGNLWNTIADTLLKNIGSFKNLKKQKNYEIKLEFVNLSLW